MKINNNYQDRVLIGKDVSSEKFKEHSIKCYNTNSKVIKAVLIFFGWATNVFIKGQAYLVNNKSFAKFRIQKAGEDITPKKLKDKISELKAHKNKSVDSLLYNDVDNLIKNVHAEMRVRLLAKNTQTSYQIAINILFEKSNINKKFIYDASSFKDLKDQLAKYYNINSSHSVYSPPCMESHIDLDLKLLQLWNKYALLLLNNGEIIIYEKREEDAKFIVYYDLKGEKHTEDYSQFIEKHGVKERLNLEF